MAMVALLGTFGHTLAKKIGISMSTRVLLNFEKVVRNYSNFREAGGQNQISTQYQYLV